MHLTKLNCICITLTLNLDEFRCLTLTNDIFIWLIHTPFVSRGASLVLNRKPVKPSVLNWKSCRQFVLSPAVAPPLQLAELIWDYWNGPTWANRILEAKTRMVSWIESELLRFQELANIGTSRRWVGWLVVQVLKRWMLGSLFVCPESLTQHVCKCLQGADSGCAGKKDDAALKCAANFSWLEGSIVIVDLPKNLKDMDDRINQKMRSKSRTERWKWMEDDGRFYLISVWWVRASRCQPRKPDTMSGCCPLILAGTWDDCTSRQGCACMIVV